MKKLNVCIFHYATKAQVLFSKATILAFAFLFVNLSIYAQFTPNPNAYYNIIAKHSGKCLDVDMASMETGGKIVQWEVNGNENQQWKFVPSAQWPGFYTIVAKHSGKSIVPLYGSSDNGAAIVQIEANAATVYKLVATGGDYYTFVAGHSGKAIDVDMASGANGGKIVQWEVNGNPNQQFKMVAVSPPTQKRRN